METSGSSGEPKRVVLSRPALLASVAATERRLGGAGRGCWPCPASYVAGLQVVCRSLVAGPAPALLEEHGSVAAAAEAADLDFVSLVPTQLHRMLDPAETAALRTFRTVLLGGGPIDPGAARAGGRRGVAVVATYGSAETAGGCVYDGVALDGVGLAVDGDGRLRIAGPVLFDRYDGDPALTARVLVDGWFLTSDAARIDADGRLQVLGRLDDIVVTGGVNVPAPAVARRLRDHPAVAEVEVLGVADAEWGNRLVAFVVGASTSTTPAPGSGRPIPARGRPARSCASMRSRRSPTGSPTEFSCGCGRLEMNHGGRHGHHDRVVGGDHDGAVVGQRRQGVEHQPGVVAILVRGRLVEDRDRGARVRAPPRPTRCRSPSEISPGKRSSRWSTASEAASAETSAARSESASAMLSCTVSVSRRASRCGTNTVRAVRSTMPDVGRSHPARIETRVLFPVPDGPVTASTSAASTVTLVGRSASTAWPRTSYEREMSVAARSGSTIGTLRRVEDDPAVLDLDRDPAVREERARLGRQCTRPLASMTPSRVAARTSCSVVSTPWSRCSSRSASCVIRGSWVV